MAFKVGDQVVLVANRDGLLPGSTGTVQRVYEGTTTVVITIENPHPGSHAACHPGQRWSVLHNQIEHDVNENAVLIEGDDDDDCI